MKTSPSLIPLLIASGFAAGIACAFAERRLAPQRPRAEPDPFDVPRSEVLVAPSSSGDSRRSRFFR